MQTLRFTFFIFIFLIADTAPVRSGDVAVLVSSDAKGYEEALEGFRDVVGHRVVSVQTLKDNPSGWRDELKKLRSAIEPDLVFVIGTPALQAISGEIHNIPVVHAMVFNPFGISPSVGKNVVGISMIPSAAQAISLLRELNPKYRRVGTMLDPSRTGPLLSQARLIFQKEGLQLIAREIRSAGDIGAALKSLENEIDLLWLWPDETFLADDILHRIFLFSFDRKIPVLGLSERHTQMGALASLSYASAKDMGRQAGDAVKRLLGEGETTTAPQIALRQTKLTVNLKTARKLDLKIPESIIQRADNAIKAPVYRNGDWWVFRTKKVYENGKSEVEDHRITFRNGVFESDDPSFVRGEDIARNPSFLPFATVYLADPTRRWLDFPLLPGKTWSFQYYRRYFPPAEVTFRGVPAGIRSNWVNASAEAKGNSSVITQTGKFDAIEINRWDFLYTPAYLTYFYSPQTKSIVKLEADIDPRDSMSNAIRFELELIAYGTQATEKKDLR